MKTWQFRKTDKQRLLKALEAAQEIRKRGYDCQNESSHVLHAITELLNAEGRETRRVGFDDDYFWS